MYFFFPAGYLVNYPVPTKHLDFNPAFALQQAWSQWGGSPIGRPRRSDNRFLSGSNIVKPLPAEVICLV